jgi:hypothetical protein
MIGLFSTDESYTQSCPDRIINQWIDSLGGNVAVEGGHKATPLQRRFVGWFIITPNKTTNRAGTHHPNR